MVDICRIRNGNNRTREIILTESIRNFGRGPRIGLGYTKAVKGAEQVEAKLIEKVKKLPDREQEKLLKQLAKGGE